MYTRSTLGKILIIHDTDGHGVASGAIAIIAARQNYTQINNFSRFPDCRPDMLPQTIQRNFAGITQQWDVLFVDTPVDLKNPANYIDTLHSLAMFRPGSVHYIDHHETTIQFLQQLRAAGINAFVPSTSSLDMSLFVAEYLGGSRKDQVIERLAIIGAICDRDPTVIQRGLWNEELQAIADGLDVAVRRNVPGDVARALADNPEAQLEQLRNLATTMPTVRGEARGIVAIATERLPEGWGPKALEKLAIELGTKYAVGIEYVSRQNQWIVRVIALWTEMAKDPKMPLPGNLIREKLNEPRTIIGHPAAPSISAISEEDAKQLAEKIVNILNEEYYGFVTPRVQRFINEYEIGRVLVEILNEMRKMYREYLDLKRRQVELLERSSDRRYD